MDPKHCVDGDSLWYPEWQMPYRDALVELDPKVLPERIRTAEAVIRDRLRVLECSVDGAAGERQALHDALGMLRILERVA